MVGGGSPTDFRLRQRNSSTVNLPTYGGNSNGSGVVSFIQGQNAGSPSGSFQVSGSGGGFTGTGSDCTLPPIVLHVIIKGAGSGSVDLSTPAVTCSSPSASDSDCEQLYGSSTMVTMTATADGGSSFVGWGGACAAEGSGTCIRTIAAARTVTATFD